MESSIRLGGLFLEIMAACTFKEEMMSEILGLPDNLRPVAIIPVDYPARFQKRLNAFP